MLADHRCPQQILFIGRCGPNLEAPGRCSSPFNSFPVLVTQAPREPATTTRRTSRAGLVGSAATGLVTCGGQGCRLLAPGRKVEDREGAPDGQCQTGAKTSQNRRLGEEIHAKAAAGIAFMQAIDEDLSGAQLRLQKVEQKLSWREATSIGPHRQTDADQQTQQE